MDFILYKDDKNDKHVEFANEREEILKPEKIQPVDLDKLPF